jgi:cytochrome P450
MVLMYALTRLAMSPQIQEKLFAETRAVCGERSIEFADVRHLIYALCVMYETMRLHPITASLSMKALTNERETLLGKYTVPKNTVLGMDLYNLHRNERYWDNPSEFDPSRFDGRNIADLDGKIKVPCKGAFFGFSEGPRACLGTEHSVHH